MICIQSTKGDMFYAGTIVKTKQLVDGEETGKFEILNYALAKESEIGIADFGVLGVYDSERADMILNDIKAAIEKGQIVFEMPQE